MKRTALKRKPAKRRPPGVGCQRKGRKSCRKDAVTTIDGIRLCALDAADRVFGAHVRGDASCWGAWFTDVRCGGEWQACHIITRERRAIRWTRDNVKCMCAGHHVWFTHHPDAWQAYVRDRGVDFDALRLRGYNGTPQDPMEIIERYRP
jgi:hypothetical protein